MRRSRHLATSAAALALSLAAGCSLIPLQVSSDGPFGSSSEEARAEQERQRAERERRREEQRQADERRAAQKAAEDAAREQAILNDISALRAEIASRGPASGNKAVDFAKLVVAASATAAAKDGRVSIAELAPEAASYIEKAMSAAPSMDLFDAIASLPDAPGIDAAVLRACQRVRPKVSGDNLVDFMDACLERADGDSKRLKWAGVDRDLAAHKQATDARLSAEAAAKQEQAKMARYVAAAVFASGRCNFSNCLKDGWTASSPEGDIQVRCEFQDCFKNGWTARFPDGSEARTRCSFSNCIKDGWETSYPDGQSSRTRCSFSNCLKDGWETELPGGSTARTRCSFQDCSKDGWETDMPGGGRTQCRCNFQKCFENGATCG